MLQMGGRFIRRLVLSTLAAFVAMMVTVLILTVADLYLVGHGHQSINQALLTCPAAGISMSRADIFLLLAGLAAWCVTWRRGTASTARSRVQAGRTRIDRQE